MRLWPAPSVRPPLSDPPPRAPWSLPCPGRREQRCRERGDRRLSRQRGRFLRLHPTVGSPVPHFLRPHFSPAAGRSAFPLAVCDGSSSRTACPASLLRVPLVTALRPSDRGKAGLFPAFIRISLALGNVAPFHVWGRPFRPHPFVIGRLIFPVAGCAGLQDSDVSPWGRQVSRPGGRLAVLLTVSCAQRFLPSPPFLSTVPRDVSESSRGECAFHSQEEATAAGFSGRPAWSAHGT